MPIKPPTFTKRYSFLLLIFLTGFTSLIYEIYSTRILFFFFSETDWAITIGITSFLAGIAFSSLFFSSFTKKQTKNVFLILWIMQISISIYGFFFLRQYALIPTILDFLLRNSTNIVLITASKIALIWLFLFVPAFFIGGAFPLVNGLYLKNLDKKIHDTSIVYFWDTFGSLIGGLMTGFWFLPFFGFQTTATIGVSTNLLIAVWIAPKKIYRILTLFFIVFIIVNLNFFTFSTDAQSAQKIYLNNQLLNKRFGNILFQKVSPYGVVTIGDNAFEIPGNKALFINYRDMCWTDVHHSESTVGELTAQQLPKQSNVLNIGLGCGFTADANAQQKNVSNLDIVEINPVVAEGTKKFLSRENNNVLSNTKTNLLIQDGAAYIRNTTNAYQAVVIDIEEPTIVDSSPLFTSDYFSYIHTKLTPNGILALWSPHASNAFEKVIYNTLKTKFTYVSIRIVNTIPTFYASDKQYKAFLSTNPNEKKLVAAIVQSPVNDINTLDKRVLEKYFTIQGAFDFHSTYEDPFTYHAQK